MKDDANYARTVLVGLDGSPNSACALRWAVGEARTRSGSVDAIFVSQISSLAYSAPGYIPPTEDEIHREGCDILADALATMPEDPDVKVSLICTSGIPVDVIVAAAARPDVAMVAVGTRGRSGLASVVLGSVSRAVVHRSPKPVAVIPLRPPEGDADLDGKKIVVGADGSNGSERALLWAAAEGRRRGVPVEVAAVWSSPLPLGPGSPSARRTSQDDSDQQVLSTLDAMVAKVDVRGSQLHPLVLHGDPAGVLTERSRDAQLLVVGSRGRGWAREALLGSVSHACLRDAIVPIVVVPGPR